MLVTFGLSVILLTFGMAIAVIAGLQWVFYSTARGGGFRAVSDNQDIAQLMGLNKALALAVTAIAAILLAGVLAGGLSVPIAALIFRLRGAYFAIGTWVVAEVFRLTFAQISALGAVSARPCLWASCGRWRTPSPGGRR